MDADPVWIQKLIFNSTIRAPIANRWYDRNFVVLPAVNQLLWEISAFVACIALKFWYGTTAEIGMDGPHWLRSLLLYGEWCYCVVSDVFIDTGRCGMESSLSTFVEEFSHFSDAGLMPVLESLWIFFQIFKALKVLKNRHCPWKSLIFVCKCLNLIFNSVPKQVIFIVITGVSDLVAISDECSFSLILESVKLSNVKWTCLDMLIKVLFWVNVVLLEYP